MVDDSVPLAFFFTDSTQSSCIALSNRSWLPKTRAYLYKQVQNGVSLFIYV